MQDAETKEDEQEEQEQEVVVEEEKTEDAGETQEVDAADEDLSEYSESVKKRISKLTNRFREEERQKQSAIEFAESVKKQNDDLKARLDKLDTNYVGEVDNRVTAQAQAAKEAYKKALESGDADALYDAQQNISRIAMEEARLKDLKARQEEKKATTNGAAPPPPQTPAPPPQKPDPRAEQWAQENEWFGKDQTMTYAAFGVHKQLIESEGFDPNTEEYYTELDNRIKSEFPHKFTKKSSGPRVASAGATASKTVSKGRRTVKLTPSQIAIAKKLGVPLEEYAKHVKE
jgi:hypothetical protein